MQPRTLDQVLASLGTVYDPQVQQVQNAQAAIPGQLQAQESGLQAKQTQAYDDILGGARRRGLGFAGIPLAEQAKYSATEYMPALANLRTAATQQATSLQDAINQINERRATQGQSIYENERNFYEQQRQFNASQAASERAARAAAGGGFSPSYGGGGLDLSSLIGNPGSASAVQRKDGGFNYTDANGRAISAAAYYTAKGLDKQKISFTDFLRQAANAGDKGAKAALGFVGNDMGYDPRKVTSQQLADLYNSLVWGTGKSATYKPTVAAQAPRAVAPAPKLANTPVSLFSNPLAIRR